MSSTVHDVAWSAAGPAGTAAALRVLRDRPASRVLLLDAAAFPRDKACGDGIAAEVFDLLAALGAPGPGGAGAAGAAAAAAHPQRAGWSNAHCARPNRVHPAARVRRRARATPRSPGAPNCAGTGCAKCGPPGPGRARRAVRRPGRDRGRRGQLHGPAAAAARRRRRPRPSRWRMRGYAATGPDPDRMTIEFAPGRYPAYAWSFPLADGRANVGYGVFDRRGSGNRRSTSTRCAPCCPGRNRTRRTVRGHHLPLSTGPRFHPDGRVLLAGDAAATVNPLTGEGIFDAVASGALAGRAALLGARRRRRAPGRDAPLLRAPPPAQCRDGPADRPAGLPGRRRVGGGRAPQRLRRRGPAGPRPWHRAAAALALILAHLVGRR